MAGIQDIATKYSRITEIIELCGGKTIKNKLEASIIISDVPEETRTRRSRVVVVPKYILESAMKGSMEDVTLYAPK